MKWLILALGIASNASASLLIKIAVTPPRTFPTLSNPATALSNWPLLVGMVLYGLAFLLYAATLARLPLNIAHPLFSSGAVGAVVVLSMLILREPLGVRTAAGILLIVVGVCLLTSTASAGGPA